MIENKICYFNNNDKLEVLDNKVFVNGSLIDEINRGTDGIVYKYGEYAIKLYYNENKIKNHLSDYQIEILSSLEAKHIVLPIERLSSDSINAGFIMRYIDLESKKDILYEDKDEVFKQISEMETELFTIGQNHFLLEDMQEKNLFYNGTLHLFDPDSFIYDRKSIFSRRNLELFSWYFMRDVIFSLNNELTKKEQTSLVRKLHYLYQKGKYTSLSEFLYDNIYENNLAEFRTHLIKEKVR